MDVLHEAPEANPSADISQSSHGHGDAGKSTSHTGDLKSSANPNQRLYEAQLSTLSAENSNSTAAADGDIQDASVSRLSTSSNQIEASGETENTDSKYRVTSALDASKFPASYSSNSAHEEKAMHFASNFRRQYGTLFPSRKELLLMPENEFGVCKLICTTIRPTKLAHKELYDYHSCARFVSDYVSYKLLGTPFDLPSRICSPTHVMATQQGNSFEMSILLTSLLRGVGFDAYVVSGYASRRLAMRDETVVDADIERLLDEYGFRDITGACEDTSFDGLESVRRFVPSLRSRGLTEQKSTRNTKNSDSNLSVHANASSRNFAASSHVPGVSSVSGSGGANSSSNAIIGTGSNAAMSGSMMSAQNSQNQSGVSDEKTGGGDGTGSRPMSASARGAAANAVAQNGASSNVSSTAASGGVFNAAGTTTAAGASANIANTGSGLAASAIGTGGTAGSTTAGGLASARYKMSKYRAKSKPELKSKYLDKMSAREQEAARKKEQDDRDKQLKEATPAEPEDLMVGMRVHAWVLVLPGKRDIAEPFFIESSTGKVYDYEHRGYLGIESVCNSQNIWINMQKCFNALKGISFDLSNSADWEYLFSRSSADSNEIDKDDSDPSKIRSASTRGDAASKSASSKHSNSTREDGTSAEGGTGAAVDEEDDDETRQRSGKNFQASDAFDAPASWVSALEIAREQLESQCPAGEKSLTWRNVKLDIYAPYHRSDGLTVRLTRFSDKLRDIRGKIYERYHYRKDKLWLRVREPSTGIEHEHFERGRSQGLQTHVKVCGRTRVLLFYRTARSNGLYSREELMGKVYEHYEGRDDRLFRRSITYEVPGLISPGVSMIGGVAMPAAMRPSLGGTSIEASAALAVEKGKDSTVRSVTLATNSASSEAGRHGAGPSVLMASAAGSLAGGGDLVEVTLAKVTEYYDRRSTLGRTVKPDSDEKDASSAAPATGEENECNDLASCGPGDETMPMHFSEIRKRTFNIRDERVRIVYHVPEGCLIPAWCEFRKPPPDQKTSFIDLMASLETHAGPRPLRRQHLYARFCDLLQAEQMCLSSVSQSDREIKAIIKNREEEEKNVQLAVSMFDTIRNKTDIAKELEKENRKQAEEASKESTVDYLSPFIVSVLQDTARDADIQCERLTREEAQAIRDACVRAMRERLGNRVAIIQRRYEEESAAYQAKQQYYSQHAESMTREETDEYVRFCNESMFRINVLENRLANQKEAAPGILARLERRLSHDQRLARHLGGGAGAGQ